MIHLYIVIGCIIAMIILVLFFIDHRTLHEQNDDIQRDIQSRHDKKMSKHFGIDIGNDCDISNSFNGRNITTYKIPDGEIWKDNDLI